jgi:hypothetical protein
MRSLLRGDRADALPKDALLFGRMYEDAAVELHALAAANVPPDAPLFCIASAGCTALLLARRG